MDQLVKFVHEWWENEGSYVLHDCGGTMTGRDVKNFVGESCNIPSFVMLSFEEQEKLLNIAFPYEKYLNF